MKHESVNRLPSRRARARRWWGLALAALVLLGLGCARFPGEKIPHFKLLIMPFQQQPGLENSPLAISGWWFGARTLRQNPRAGILIADILGRKMARLAFLNIFSAIEIRYYFADKRQRLKEQFPNLTDAEAEGLIEQVPPTEYGRDLGADKILSGRIIRETMAENRTIHWWWSVLEVEATITDVASGKVEWSRKYDLRRQFAFHTTMQEEFADRLMGDLQKSYFRKMVKK